MLFDELLRTPSTRSSRNTSSRVCEVDPPAATVVATNSVSANTDYDNGISLQPHACAGLGIRRRRLLPHIRVNEGNRKGRNPSSSGLSVSDPSLPRAVWT